ncbi:hypothetical protein [Spirosoma validum]|uniref:Uncharacterized protein n=1 Tax=Spirosoma validum TaxID=2771355 RepID=A0A927GGZ6_9BACT|nr:hypothetical protein [Spirosoma validum]MBD2757135.1 hypothetical protein [Spirosoma validum]
MPRSKQLPKPIRRHYVGEPVIVIPLTQLEALLQHLIDIAMLDRKTPGQQAAVWQNHEKILKHCQAEIDAAKAFYHIVS